MTAKELLRKIILLRKDIDYKKSRVEMLTDIARGTSVSLTGMPKNPSADPERMASAVCQRIDLENEIAELEKERNGYISLIDLLENGDYKRLLMLRYVQEARWDDIASSLGFSAPWVYKAHQKAVGDLDKALKSL